MRPLPDWPIERDLIYGCWLWSEPLDKAGYGSVWKSKGFRTLAHHAVWIEKHGPIPEGRELDHLCRRRHCVNPAHLELVTRRENVRRIQWRNRVNRPCPKGHDMFKNGRRTPEGGIICRSCSGLTGGR